MHISELISVTITVPARDIERFLDDLAALPYSINPTLRYEEHFTRIDFPAWRTWLDNLHDLLRTKAFQSARLRYRPALEPVVRNSNAQISNTATRLAS